MKKEVNDALHTLLSMALENNRYETQKKQFDIVYKEIERLQHNQEVSTKWEIKLTQNNTKLKEENKRLNSIIKEAIEYIDKYTLDEDGTRKDYANEYIDVDELLEILDKVGSENNDK